MVIDAIGKFVFKHILRFCIRLRSIHTCMSTSFDSWLLKRNLAS